MYGLFFVFKQKTAYEMRISDWSSDVCSSDLKESSLDILVNNAGAAWGESFDTRSEERRAGKECVSTCRSRWSPYNEKNNSMDRTKKNHRQHGSKMYSNELN